MHLPQIDHWMPTALGLHRAAFLLGAVRMMRLPHVPNYLELGMEVGPTGLSTGVLPGGAEVLLDMQEGRFTVTAPDGSAAHIPLAGQSQASLLAALLDALARHELAEALSTAPGDSNTARMVAFLAQSRHKYPPKHEQLADERPLEIDPETAARYAVAQYRVFTALARFRARLLGPMTPAVVWPEHFDLSFLWFKTAEAEEHAPHINFGFAPYSPGLERPYLYAYAWPRREGATLPELPAPARWETEVYTGVYVAYDDLLQYDKPELKIEGLCRRIYSALLDVLV